VFRTSLLVREAFLYTQLERSLNRTRFLGTKELGYRLYTARLFWNPLSKQRKLLWPMILWPKDLPKKGWVNHEGSSGV
jgi:hypothetical protein